MKIASFRFSPEDRGQYRRKSLNTLVVYQRGFATYRLTGFAIHEAAMNPTDLRILCTALGFTAVVMQGGKPSKKEGAVRATGFASLIEEFCRSALPDVFEAANLNLALDADIEKIDRAIDQHISDLKQNEATLLPEDKETLLKYYDRLQQRKARRMQAAFYDIADPRVLSDRVLKHLDEEIEESEATS